MNAADQQRQCGSTCARRFLFAAAWVVGAFTSACFEGGDALHLPCERDDDCGLDQRCVVAEGAPADALGFCDGPPPGAEESGTAGTSSDGGSSDSGPEVPVCGNGAVESGEDCDEGVDSATCNSPSGCEGSACCRAPVCGDGYANAAADEDCDEGLDSATCNSAPECRGPACCQANACGDGYVNPSTELCDGGECAPGDCTLLWRDTFDQPLDVDWVVGVPEGMRTTYPEVPALNWVRAGNNTLRTGPYPPDPDDLRNAHRGGVAWVQRREPTTLPTALPPGTSLQLRFTHRYHFDPGIDCGNAGAGVEDGGLVMLVDSRGVRVAQPQEGYPITIMDSAGCAAQSDIDPSYVANPLVGVGAFGGLQVLQVEVVVPLDEYLGQTVAIGFLAGYDCGACWLVPGTDAGWVIDDVRVGAF